MNPRELAKKSNELRPGRWVGRIFNGSFQNLIAARADTDNSRSHLDIGDRVLLCVALGTFVLFRGHSFWQLALGLYFIALGINYVPLLACAVAITRGQSAHAEIDDELNDERRAMAKYRRQSILLLVPLLVPILALAWERRKAQAGQTGAKG